MNDVEQLHRRAMEAAERADLARLRGADEQYRALIREAFGLERQAATLVASSELEPTRSVLHQSAASLALEIGDHRAAEQLIGVGLAGSPPVELLAELRSLLQEVHFRQSLAIDDIELAPNEIQFSMIGGQVGEGIAPSDEFTRRVEILDMLVFRSAERKAGRPFRAHGRRDKGLKQDVELFMKVPRAASFAVNFQLGTSGLYPEGDPGVQVVDDIVGCLDLFTRSAIEPLKAMIDNESYFRNFVALASSMAPDGKRVGKVGIAGRSGGQTMAVLLKPPSATDARLYSVAPEEHTAERVTVRGLLLFADAEGKNWGKIDIIQESGEKTRLRVPPGLMADIVRPYFQFNVVVGGHRKGKQLYLDDIRPDP